VRLLLESWCSCTGSLEPEEIDANEAASTFPFSYPGFLDTREGGNTYRTRSLLTPFPYPLDITLKPCIPSAFGPCDISSISYSRRSTTQQNASSWLSPTKQCRLVQRHTKRPSRVTCTSGVWHNCRRYVPQAQSSGPARIVDGPACQTLTQVHTCYLIAVICSRKAHQE
jgi:hypothetical protein